MQRVFGHAEGDAYFVGEALVEAAQQGAAACEVDAVLHDVGIQLGRCVLKGRQHGVLNLCHRLVEAVGYLLIAHGHLHGQGGDAVGAVHDVVLRSFVAQVGEGGADVDLTRGIGLIVRRGRNHAADMKHVIDAGDALQDRIVIQKIAPDDLDVFVAQIRFKAVFIGFGRTRKEMDFDQIVVSVKSTDVPMCIRAHEMIAQTCAYPLHIGITEAGTPFRGTVKSAAGLGILLWEGLGDTLRISLTGDPVQEVKAAKLLLEALDLRRQGIEVVSCPTCGRTQIDLITLAQQVETLAAGYDYPIRIAVMGCVVNGPGEAKEADLGIAGGRGEGLLIKKGEIVKKLPEGELLAALKDELDHWEG